MRLLPRLVAGFAALTLTAPVVPAQEPRADRVGSAVAVEITPDWRELGTDSLEIAPETMAEDAPARETVRVVTVTEEQGRPDVAVTEVAGRDAAVEAIAEAQADPEVLAVEVDTKVSAVQIPTPPWNDAWRPNQWALNRLSAEEATARLGARNAVLIAVLDTGVQADTTDLSGLVAPGIDYYVPSRQGRVDDNGHGTNVASIIAAHANNNVQMAGYNQSVRILPIKVLDTDGNADNATVTQGILDATAAGAQVINLSLGGPFYSPSQEMAVAAARAQGIVVVAASGNLKQAGNPILYPGAYPGVLAVGATASNDTIAAFSNTGSHVDLVAPGVDIVVLGNDDFIDIGDGTSYATPYVAGLAAQLRAANPAITPAQVDQVLTSTATDLGPAGRDDTYGHGIINPLSALCAVGVCATVPGTPAIPAATPGDGQVALTWAAPASTGGTPIRGYTVTTSPGGQTQNLPATARSATVSGLTNATTYTFSIRAVNSVGASPAATVQATPRSPGAADLVTRLSGPDRYATAAAIAGQFPSGGEVLYVASGQNFPDALAGAALTATRDAPVVLVRSDGIPTPTAQVLGELVPQRIVVLGGTGSVNEQVEAQLSAYATADTPDEVTRLSGADRYATAAAIAGEFPAGAEVVYVASGQNFPDALAGAALAGSQGAPVLLVRSDGIPTATHEALRELFPFRVVVLGGTGSVSTNVLALLREYTAGDEASRLAGADRYATAAAIAGKFPTGGEVTYVANGQNFPDALAGAALAGSRDAPVVLVRTDRIPAPSDSALSGLQPQTITIFGGTGAVNEQVQGQLTAYVQ